MQQRQMETAPAKSLPVRGAWIEMLAGSRQNLQPGQSLPVRGAWIEIRVLAVGCAQGVVAPRAGSVD